MSNGYWDQNNLSCTGRLVGPWRFYSRPDGVSSAHNRLAVAEGKAADGNDRASFFDIVVWGEKKCQAVMKTEKGQQITISRGRLKSFFKTHEGLFTADGKPVNPESKHPGCVFENRVEIVIDSWTAGPKSKKSQEAAAAVAPAPAEGAQQNPSQMAAIAQLLANPQAMQNMLTMAQQLTSTLNATADVVEQQRQADGMASTNVEETPNAHQPAPPWEG